MSELGNPTIALVCQPVDDGFYYLGAMFAVHISPTLLVNDLKGSIIKAMVNVDINQITAAEL